MLTERVYDDDYAAVVGDISSGYRALQPPQRISVAESARRHLVLTAPGQPKRHWSSTETPYMVEPMNMLASRRHEGVVFVGPARTGKTAALLLGLLTHAAMSDPGDLLIMHMNKDKAREFSKTDIGRALRNSDDLRGMLGPKSTDSNTFDQIFRHGMWMRIAWPTSSNVSGSTYRYTGVTDLDRIANAENVDGEGPLFDMMRKRTTTYMSRGMSLAESSPGIEVVDPNWKPETPHEAPPVTGILGLYNTSDRRRWYWECPDCHDRFEAAPGLGLFHLPSDDALLDDIRKANIPAMAAHFGARVICPHCGSLIDAKWKQHLNQHGLWLPEGVEVVDGEMVGDALLSTIAGYWMGGVAAAYQTWTSLIERQLQALRNYALTGSEEKLKVTINTDQGLPYTSRHLIESRRVEASPKERQEPELQQYICPPETRAVLVSVDVQGGQNARFEVLVQAYGPHLERWPVDRFTIKTSKREGIGGDFAPIDPAKYAEDWDVLTDLLRKTYRTDDSEREIRTLRLVVDSGGEAGATDKAYAWYRRVRALGLHQRVRLYKGGSTKDTPMIRETMVGHPSDPKKNDIPLLLCNPHLLSDAVDAGLRRPDPGPGYVHFGSWLPDQFFDELGAEVRGVDGTWKKIREKARNESFDLMRMGHACALSLGLDKITDWAAAAVPAHLRPLDAGNSEVMTPSERRALQERAAQMGRQVVRPARRSRSTQSSYLR